MKKYYYTLLFNFLLLTASYATVLKGTVSDQTGEVLPYASIFVEETGAGTTTNAEGNYAIELASGTYNIRFQYLGYQSETRSIRVTNEPVQTLNIVLSPQILELKSLEISDDREDPAYTIMRKAIAKASYHREQIESYSAKVYTKGTGSVSTPEFLDKMIEKQGIDSVAFISESVSEIAYQRPNTFKEKVISIRQQGETQGVSLSPSPYLQASFYQSRFGNAVSPLSPRAMSYYRFEFLGSYLDSGIEVNKIKVSPKNPGEGVFEGTISIVEDTWGIYSLDLTTYTLGIILNIKQFYQLIDDKAWLPTVQQFQFDTKALGFGLRYNYYATSSDYIIALNPDLAVDFDLVDETIAPETVQTQTDKKAIKEGDLATTLASEEPLKMKDLRKAMKSYQKQARKEQEEKRLNSVQEMIIDSSAYNRDTAFWETVRTIPLTEYEQKSYRIADSIAVAEKAAAEAEAAASKGKDKFKLFDLVAGSSYRLGEKTQIIYESPITKLNINTVEGYHIGTDLSLKYQINERKALQIGYVPRYSFAQNQYRSMGYLNLDIGKPDRTGILRVEGGKFIAQLNDNNPINPLVNAFHTLLFQENFMKILERSYASVHYDQQILDRLYVDVRASYMRRNPLQNNDNVRPWVGNRSDFNTNTPFNAAIGAATFDTHELWRIDLGMAWRPWQRYNINNGEKVFFNRGPAFFVHYSKAGMDADYDFLEGGIKYNLNRWDGSQFDLKLSVGRFLNKTQVFFPDFKHFSDNQALFITNPDPVESFRLLPYYEFSTPNGFLEAHAQ
ncbi:MAG: DUF5686 and carboxypeptidase regulatory-like domain-containing protein, partial [Bacteroidota bacterium]